MNLCCVIKSLRLTSKTPAGANSSPPSPQKHRFPAALVLMLSSVQPQKAQVMKLPWGAVPQHQVVSFEIHIPLSSSHYIYVTDFQKGSVLIFLHGRRWREGSFWPLFSSPHPGLPEDKQCPFLSFFNTASPHRLPKILSAGASGIQAFQIILCARAQSPSFCTSDSSTEAGSQLLCGRLTHLETDALHIVIL